MSPRGGTHAQVVQESQTSAVFSIAMVVAYDVCIVSQVRHSTKQCLHLSSSQLCIQLGCAHAYSSSLP